MYLKEKINEESNEQLSLLNKFGYDEGVKQEIILMRRDLNVDYGNGNNEQHDLSAAATSNNAGGTTVSTGAKTK